jgi:putative transposase
VKRSVLTDARGVVLGLVIGPANRHDLKLAVATLDSQPMHRPATGPWHRQHLCGDKAYEDAAFSQRLQRRHYLPHIKSRGQEISDRKRHPHAKARRWVNERTQSWFNRFRRVLIRWEKKANNYLAILEFVAAWIAFRAAGVLR